MICLSVRAGSIRNLESARVSIVGQLRKVVIDNYGDISSDFSKDTPIVSSDGTHSVMQTKICEEEDDKEEQTEKQEPLNQNVFSMPESIVNI